MVYLQTYCVDCLPSYRLPVDQETKQRYEQSRDPENRRVRARKYRAEHPEEVKRRKFAYTNLKVRRVSSLVNGKLVQVAIPRPEWQAILDTFHHACAYCGERTNKLETDHFIPVVLGGESVIGNLVPACRSCNASKNMKHPAEWLTQEQYDYIIKVLHV